MTAIRKTASHLTQKGSHVDVKIERTRGVRGKVANLDGDRVNLGKETYDRLNIELWIDGVNRCRTNQEPSIVTEAGYGNDYKTLKAKGVFARIGDIYIAEELYNVIMGLLAEIEAELTTTPEYEEVKAQEIAKEEQKKENSLKRAKEHERRIKNGLCPKCGTYCYGDCGAN
jgi:hypothetical protein